jgi:hypothetical protein
MKIEQWHRRHAVMLASQLPESMADSMAILERLKELVETFLQSDARASQGHSLVRDCPDLSA